MLNPLFLLFHSPKPHASRATRLSPIFTAPSPSPTSSRPNSGGISSPLSSRASRQIRQTQEHRSVTSASARAPLSLANDTLRYRRRLPLLRRRPQVNSDHPVPSRSRTHLFI